MATLECCFFLFWSDMNLHIAAQINSFLAALVLLTVRYAGQKRPYYGAINPVCPAGAVLSLNPQSSALWRANTSLYIVRAYSS